MSVVVAIKKNGVIYLGADSQVTRGSTRTSLSNPNNYKIWKVRDVENCVMGHVGDLRDACVVKIIRGLVDELTIIHQAVDFEYVVTRVMPRIFSELAEYQFIDPKGVFEGIHSKFLFAYQDKLFVIGTDGSVIEIDDCVAIGSGESEAIGSLLTTLEDDEPTERIIKAIKSSAAHDIYVDYPIVITNTLDTTFTVIDDKNNKRLISS